MKITLNILVATFKFEYSIQSFKQDPVYLAKFVTHSLKKHTQNWRRFHPRKKRPQSWLILVPEVLITATMTVYGIFCFALTGLTLTGKNNALSVYFGGLGMATIFFSIAFFYWTGLYNTSQKNRVKLHLPLVRKSTKRRHTGH